MDKGGKYMKKYLIVGLVTFSLMATTAYALSDNNKNNLANEPANYNQNCPYHDNYEECPYYDKTTNTPNCPYRENGTCQNNNNNHVNGHNRHGGCHRHQQ